MLVRLFNIILINERIPEEWKQSELIIIYKSGDTENVKNYRPISLLSHVYKVFVKVLLARTQNKMDDYQPREQAGFRKGFSTTDHLQVVTQLIEKADEYQQCLCLGFIDFEKAFDSVEHSFILEALREEGIESKYIKIIENIYNGSKSFIEMEGVREWIDINRGVRMVGKTVYGWTTEDIQGDGLG